MKKILIVSLAFAAGMTGSMFANEEKNTQEKVLQMKIIRKENELSARFDELGVWVGGNTNIPLIARQKLYIEFLNEQRSLLKKFMSAMVVRADELAKEEAKAQDNSR